MIGVINVGGGNRASFGAGVFDYCLEHEIGFDCCYGISAGSGNCVSFVAKQRGRNYRFYTDYNLSSSSISLGNYIRSGSMTNLDHIYCELSNSYGKDPLDYDTFVTSKTDLYVVATEVRSGSAVYFSKDELQKHDYRCLCASCALPIIN